jgi:hypothetical protein
LCGSPLDENLDWGEFSSQIQSVQNYYSNVDSVIKAVQTMKQLGLSGFAPPYLGTAGLEGFKKTASGITVENLRCTCDHSNYFTDYKTIQYDWLPYLLTQSGFHDLCRQCQQGRNLEIIDLMFGRDVEKYARLLAVRAGRVSAQRWAEYLQYQVVRLGALNANVEARTVVDRVYSKILTTLTSKS